MDDLIQILKMSEQELMQYCITLAENSGYEICTDKKNFVHIYPNEAKLWDLPTLSSHLDLVGNIPPKNVEISGNVLSLPADDPAYCLGGDDRCGIYIITELIKQKNKNYQFLLFTQEEVGCVGSGNFVGTFPTFPTNCFIGLDREAGDHCATYGTDSDELIEEFEKLGYKQHYGSMTDVAVLGEAYGIPCVNLSIGYYKQHTKKEYINFDETCKTLEILQNLDLRGQKYPISEYFDENVSFIYDFEPISCEICGETHELYSNGFETLCQNCLLADDALY